MPELLTKSKQTILEDGPVAFTTKALRKALSPILGKERAKMNYYDMNRKLKYRTLSPPEFECQNDIINISGEECQSFFGFYDKTPFGPNNNRILFNRVDAPVQQSSREEYPLEICYYDIDDDNVVKFGETNTWNWQQGCRLQWLPGSSNKVIYNRMVNGGYGAVIQNIKSEKILKELKHPIYDVDPNGKYALSIDFERLECGISDYGYNNKNVVDNSLNEGIYRVDLNTEDSKLLLSLDRISNQATFSSKNQPYIMNLMFSPDGDKFSFLYRYNKYGSYRPTNLMCATTNGDIIEALGKEGNPSHPTWKSNTELLSTVKYSNNNQSTTRYEIYNTSTGNKSRLDHSYFDFDSHPNFAPAPDDILILDTYPNDCGELDLYFLNVETESYKKIGSFYGPTKQDTKRDLHPRWDRKGKYICIDRPTEKNGRALSLISVDDCADNLFRDC